MREIYKLHELLEATTSPALRGDKQYRIEYTAKDSNGKISNQYLIVKSSRPLSKSDAIARAKKKADYRGGEYNDFVGYKEINQELSPW
jgi:hypothetical protein